MALCPSSGTKCNLPVSHHTQAIQSVDYIEPQELQTALRIYRVVATDWSYKRYYFVL